MVRVRVRVRVRDIGLGLGLASTATATAIHVLRSAELGRNLDGFFVRLFGVKPQPEKLHEKLATVNGFRV